MRSVLSDRFGQKTIVETIGTDVTIGVHADVTAVLERNKRAQTDLGTDFSDEAIVPVCSIPVSLIPFFKSVHGLDLMNDDDLDRAVRLIETDPDLRHLRTNSKVIFG